MLWSPDESNYTVLLMQPHGEVEPVPPAFGIGIAISLEEGSAGFLPTPNSFR